MGILGRINIMVGLGMLVLFNLPSNCEAACACSRIGVSNGYYANPSTYGGPGTAYYQIPANAQSVGPKKSKVKKASPKQKPDSK